MKIILPSVQIINPFGKFMSETEHLDALVQHCEWEARKSHGSQDRIAEGSAQKLLEFIVMTKGDFSVIEHANLTVDFTVDRGVTHEQVRHRIASYTQESTRFINYDKDDGTGKPKHPPRFLFPQVRGQFFVQCKLCLECNEPVKVDRNEWWHNLDVMKETGVECKYDKNWLSGIDSCEQEYKALLAKGWRPQEARSVMPNAQAADIGVTMNMRGWRHVLLMRTTAEAHPQIEQVMSRLLVMFKQSPWGWLFQDVESGRKQAQSISRMR